MPDLAQQCEIDVPFIGRALEWASQRLQQAGVEGAANDARILLQLAGGFSRTEMIANPRALMPDEIRAAFVEMIMRRCKREPVSRIAGRREFWKHEFEINAGTLDPRPDTEALVEFVLAFVKNRQHQDPHILDIGTGSGAIICSLLSDLPDSRGVATDIDQNACAVAARNAARLGLDARCKIFQTSWADGIDSAFDIIVSNPPYIPTSEIALLEPEVRNWDPALGLDGGEDGLDAFRSIADIAAKRLKPGGLLAAEIGKGQEADVSALFHHAGLVDAGGKRDLQGIWRVIAAAKPGRGS